MYFNYHASVLNFLLIWISLNPMRLYKKGLDFKTLEYTFNKSQMINYLRCLWLPPSYMHIKYVMVQGQDVIRGIEECMDCKHNNFYKDLPKKYEQFRKAIEQCGYKPSLETDEDIENAQYKKSIYNLERFNAEGYTKYFLEY